MRHPEGLGEKKETPNEWSWGQRRDDMFDISLTGSLEAAFLDANAGVVLVPEIPAGFTNGVRVVVQTESGRGRVPGRAWLNSDGSQVQIDRIRLAHPVQPLSLSPSEVEDVHFRKLGHQRWLSPDRVAQEIEIARQLQDLGYVDGAEIRWKGELEVLVIRWAQSSQNAMPGYEDIPILTFTGNTPANSGNSLPSIFLRLHVGETVQLVKE